MDFKTLLIIKHPVESAWVAMRDHLPEIAALTEEIESLQTREKIEITPGILQVISDWKANPQLPKPIAHYTKPEWFSWTDTAVWNDATKTCQWTLHPLAFSQQLEIVGSSLMEAALGGQGTRITIQGQLTFLPSAAGQMGKLASLGIEPILKQVITNSFNRMSKALSEYLTNLATA
jgi:hypothetical protein